MFYFTFATLFAQTTITLRCVIGFVSFELGPHHTSRVYAVTGNNRWIASCLTFVTWVQFIFGMYLVVFFALQPGKSLFVHPGINFLRWPAVAKAVKLPDIPFDEFQVCLFQRWRTGEMAYTIFSLVYGMFCPLPPQYLSHGGTTPLRQRCIRLSHCRVHGKRSRSCATFRGVNHFRQHR